MEHRFWHERWEANRTGFHEPAVSPALADYLGVLGLGAGARVFLPLCGKTLSIRWLRERGFNVVGVEISPIAVEQLFDELGVEPEAREYDPLQLRSEGGTEIFVGDIFDLDQETLGPIDAVFDRAAYIALPADIRERYAAHVAKITAGAPQLLVSLEYDQSVMVGPPFSVSAEEIRSHYERFYDVLLLEREMLPDGVRQAGLVREAVWHMRPPAQ